MQKVRALRMEMMQGLTAILNENQTKVFQEQMQRMGQRGQRGGQGQRGQRGGARWSGRWSWWWSWWWWRWWRIKQRPLCLFSVRDIKTRVSLKKPAFVFLGALVYRKKMGYIISHLQWEDSVVPESIKHIKRPFSFAVVSDTHFVTRDFIGQAFDTTRPLSTEGYVENVTYSLAPMMDALRHLKPDFIVLTGDVAETPAGSRTPL